MAQGGDDLALVPAPGAMALAVAQLYLGVQCLVEVGRFPLRVADQGGQAGGQGWGSGGLGLGLGGHQVVVQQAEPGAHGRLAAVEPVVDGGGQGAVRVAALGVAGQDDRRELDQDLRQVAQLPQGGGGLAGVQQPAEGLGLVGDGAGPVRDQGRKPGLAGPVGAQLPAGGGGGIQLGLTEGELGPLAHRLARQASDCSLQPCSGVRVPDDLAEGVLVPSVQQGLALPAPRGEGFGIGAEPEPGKPGGHGVRAGDGGKGVGGSGHGCSPSRCRPPVGAGSGGIILRGPGRVGDGAREQ